MMVTMMTMMMMKISMEMKKMIFSKTDFEIKYGMILLLFKFILEKINSFFTNFIFKN
jgi:hypothetical protein